MLLQTETKRWRRVVQRWVVRLLRWDVEFSVKYEWDYASLPLTNKQRRIALARDALSKLSSSGNRHTKLKSLKSFCGSIHTDWIFCCRVESWAIKSNQKRIYIFHLGPYGRMDGKDITDGKENQWTAFKELGVHNRLSSMCYLRIVKLFTHIVRQREEDLEKIFAQGKDERQISWGRCPTRWIDM